MDHVVVAYFVSSSGECPRSVEKLDVVRRAA